MQLTALFKNSGGVVAAVRKVFKTKTWYVMRLTIVLLITGCMQVAASGFSQQVSITGKDIPLQQVFYAIEKQTNFVFFYNSDWLKDTRPVTISVSNASVEDLLREVLKEQGLEYSIENKTIVIQKKELPRKPVALPSDVLLPAFITVHGLVKDQEDKPVSGVYVRIKGTQRATITDNNGEFTLSAVEPTATLVFSAVNMETFEQPLNGITDLVISLKTKTTALGAVTVMVNTGYQTLSKERVTGSFAKPDMEIYKNRTGTLDIIGRLDGLVAGMVVSNGPGSAVVSGTGNGTSTQKSLIRGQSSVSLATEPLYVLNGVVVNDFSAINPDDVADITVLKDASAAAIWGARASNGVVVVVTKMGSTSNKLKVSYNGFINFQGKPDFDYVPMMNSRQFIQAAVETFDPVAFSYPSVSSTTSGYMAPHDVILYNRHRGLISAAQADASLDSLSRIDNKQQIKDLWFRNAYTTNHSIAVSGGSSLYSFYGSFAYTSTKSNVIGEQFNAYSLDFGQEYKPLKRLKISFNTALRNTVASRKRPISIANQFLPYQLFQDAEGNNISMPYTQGWSDSLRQAVQSRSRINLDFRPLEEMEYGYTKTNNLFINLTTNINLNIWKGLSFLGTYNYSKAPGTSTSYDDAKLYSLRRTAVSLTVLPSPTAAPVYYFPVTGGTYIPARNDQRLWTVRNQLTYVHNGRGGKDLVNIQLGQEANEQFSFRDQNTIYGFNESLQTSAVLDNRALNSGIPNTVTGSTGFFSPSPYFVQETQSRFTSYFALGSYTFDNKYSIDASWRVDHSNQFGSDKAVQNRPIWSIGGKWRISNESFMQGNRPVNDLAVRATYGRTGNSPRVGTASQYDILIAQSTQGFGSSIAAGPALNISQPANTTVSWETTSTVNIGVDFSLFKRRVSGTIDLYKKKTTDLINDVQANRFTGFSSFRGNIGDLRNEGIELSLRVVNVESKSFRWSTSYVFGYNKNKLKSYGVMPSFLTTASGKLSSPYYEGYSLQPVFAYMYAGLDNLGDPQIMLADKTVTKATNVAKVDDLVYKGTLTPRFNGGIVNSFSYKGFTLSANVSYSLGHVMRGYVNQQFNAFRLTGSPGSYGGNQLASFEQRWKKPGDEAITDIPSYVSNFTGFSRRNIDYYSRADIHVISASFVKLRDVTLSYSLRPQVLKWLKLEGVTLNAQANNFLIWANNNQGIDPELGTLMPGSRHAFSMGANINF